MKTIQSLALVVAVARYPAVTSAAVADGMIRLLVASRCAPRWCASALTSAILLLCCESVTYGHQGKPISSAISNESELRQEVEKQTQRLETSPSDVATLIARGQTLAALSLATNDDSDLQAAAADLQQATQLSPGDPQAWAAYADVCDCLRLHDTAIEAYSRVIELEPDNANALLMRGSLYHELGENDEAIADLDRSIRVDADSSEAYLRRGWCHVALDDFDLAIKDFESARHFDPKSPAPIAARGVIKIMQRQFSGGADDIELAIRLNPGDAGVDFKPTNSRSLSPEAIEHGKKQVAAMLRDRPVMARHVTEGDPVYTWATRKFAGEEFGDLIDWNSTDPFPFPSECSPQAPARRASISISPQRNDGHAYSFEQCWSMAVFELNNVVSLAGNKKLIDDVLHDRISRTDYIVAVLREEERSLQLTRAFYLKVFLPFLDSRGIAETSPTAWHCHDFVSPGNPDAKVDNWRRDRRWGYNDVYYDLISAERDLRAGLHEDMEKRLKKLLERSSTLTAHQLTHVHYWLGNLFAAKNDLEPALLQLSLALCLSPSMDAASLVRGRVLLDNGSVQEAIAEMTRLIGRGYELADAHCYRGTALFRLGNDRKALDDFNEAVRLAPHRADLLRSRAFAHYWTNDLDSAITDFSDAIELDPQAAGAFAGRACVWMRKQEFDRAISDCSEALRLSPQDGAAFFLRGQAYESSGMLEEAEKDFAVARQLGYEQDPAPVARDSPE
jgi:tetratricopeptide (TPR) repeat protein